MPANPTFVFDNSYTRLPPEFFTRQLPTPVSKPQLIKVNPALAAYLGVDAAQLQTAEGVEVLAGNRLAAGSDPIATVYAGHQFGGWNPQLGDGRAILLGEVVAADGQRYDVQLKGSGPTPYSRMGDGRSSLGPVLREYIVSEAMAALGVPTTRSLAAVTTGDSVVRETYLPGAILTRVAKSHIRVGTFQYFAARDEALLKVLADHVIARHYPEAAAASNPYAALLGAVVERQAQLIAQWMSLGFIHGVMNTDNMLVSGETIDYGPCAFMDEFSNLKVFSSIDRQGRYAYGNQPGIGQWNLACLAQALMPLLADDEDGQVAIAQDKVNGYAEIFRDAYNQRMAAKLGLTQASDESEALVADLLKLMSDYQLDFTLTFRALTERLRAELGEDDGHWIASLVVLPEAMEAWLQRWHEHRNHGQSLAESAQLMTAANPVFIPRNHQIELAIQEASRNQDFSRFHTLVELLAQPFQLSAEHVEFARAPDVAERVSRTFCGT